MLQKSQYIYGEVFQREVQYMLPKTYAIEKHEYTNEGGNQREGIICYQNYTIEKHNPYTRSIQREGNICYQNYAIEKNNMYTGGFPHIMHYMSHKLCYREEQYIYERYSTENAVYVTKTYATQKHDPEAEEVFHQEC
jgi:hypothetical protein